jgi:antitoxin component HigA of HigAB toxin-antitoxin module
MAMPSVVEAVEFRRQQYGLSKSQWACVLGWSPSHYSEFTAGVRRLPMDVAARCFEYGVPAEALFQRRPDKNYDHIVDLLERSIW